MKPVPFFGVLKGKNILDKKGKLGHTEPIFLKDIPGLLCVFSSQHSAVKNSQQLFYHFGLPGIFCFLDIVSVTVKKKTQKRGRYSCKHGK